MKKLFLAVAIFGLGLFAVSQMGAFPLWLDSPARLNPNDPSSSLHVFVPVVVPLVPTDTPQNTPTISQTFSATPTITISPTSSQTFSATPTITLTSTPTFTPTITDTFSPVVGTFTDTPTESPSPTDSPTTSDTPTESPTSTDSPTPTETPIVSGDPKIIDDVEDGDLLILPNGGRTGDWFGTSDGTDDPALTIIPASPGNATSAYAIEATGGSTTPSSGWGGAIGFNFMTTATPYDASAYTGVMVYMKAAAGTQTAVQIQVNDGVNSATQSYTITTSWAPYEVYFSANPCLVTTGLTTFQVLPASGVAADIWIDDVQFFTTAPPAPCFTFPGTAPVTTQVIYNGTPPDCITGGSAGQWANPAPSTISDTTDAVRPPDTYNLTANLTNSGSSPAWAGFGYNWTSWWDSSKEYDKANYDAIEFWVRGSEGGETFNMGIGCTTGGSSTIAVTGFYTVSCGLSMTYEKVRIPLCAFDWAGADTTKMREFDMNNANVPAGSSEIFYISDVSLVKY